MGEMKVEAASGSPAAASVTAAEAETPTALATSPATARLTLQPDQGDEVKATMLAGQEFDYRWSTDGAEVRFELHGEPKDAVGDEYTSYEKGNSAGANGKFRAPFDGTHGWYWKNRTDKPVTITVTGTGSFQKFALVEK